MKLYETRRRVQSRLRTKKKRKNHNFTRGGPFFFLAFRFFTFVVGCSWRFGRTIAKFRFQAQFASGQRSIFLDRIDFFLQQRCIGCCFFRRRRFSYFVVPSNSDSSIFVKSLFRQIMFSLHLYNDITRHIGNQIGDDSFENEDDMLKSKKK